MYYNSLLSFWDGEVSVREWNPRSIIIDSILVIQVPKLFNVLLALNFWVYVLWAYLRVWILREQNEENRLVWYGICTCEISGHFNCIIMILMILFASHWKEGDLVLKKATEYGAVEIWMNERVRRACANSCADFVYGFLEVMLG